jgi:hypothetical protein
VLLSELVKYPRSLLLWPLFYVALAAIVTSLASLLLTRRPRDRFLALHRGAAAGALVFLLVANVASNLRLELVLLPMAAVALALVLERGSRNGWLPFARSAAPS